MNRMSRRERIVYVFWVADWEAEELMSSILSVLYGAWILIVAWGLQVSGRTVDSLETLIPLPAWGCIGVGIGFYGMVQVIDGRIRQRMYACLTRLFFWTFLCILVLLNTPAASQVVVFLGLAILSGWASWKLIAVIRATKQVGNER